jgi:hypothetical protein
MVLVKVDAFQWFLHHIAELEHEHFKQKANATTDAARKSWNKYYCEIHMFVTRAPASPAVVNPMVSAPKFVSPTEAHPPTFTVTDLYAEMRNPSTKSKDLKATMASVASAGKRPPNNLQDAWVWNGRPDWDQVFAQMKDQAVDPDIGVFVSQSKFKRSSTKVFSLVLNLILGPLCCVRSLAHAVSSAARRLSART